MKMTREQYLKCMKIVVKWHKDSKMDQIHKGLENFTMKENKQAKNNMKPYLN